MSAISIGKIIVKTMGREAGRKAVVTQLLDKNFVEITGPSELTGIKRRRVNIAHIEPTQHEIKITLKNNSDEEIMNILTKDKNLSKFMS